MYVKSLELFNFQKHSNIKLEFSDKLNVIYGESDAGKSCIIRALKWVFFGEPKGDIIRKEGTKKTFVKVILDNGTIVKKIKSNSINAYILIKEGKEKRFDAVGKNIPEEVKKSLQVSTISIDKEDVILNIANQIALPFLIGKSATFRSKLFNKLTGSDIIDKVFQSLNKDILRIGRETKLETEHLKEQQKLLKEVIIQKDKLECLYDNFKNQYKELKKTQEQYEKLESYAKLIKEIDDNLKETNCKLVELKLVPNNLVIELKKNIDELERFKILINKIKELNIEIENTDKLLSALKIPKIDIGILKNDYLKLKKLKDLFSQLLEVKGNIINVDSEIYNYKNLITENKQKYKKLLKKIGICPICKTKVTDDIIKEMKL